MATQELRIGWKAMARETSTRCDSRGDSENPLAGKRVCVISDVPHTRMTVRQMLQAAGIWATEDAASYSEAVQCLRERKFDAVIIDGGGKPATANAFVQHVRAHEDPETSRMAIVLATDGADMETVAGIRDLGVNAILLKPFSTKILVRRIQSALERKGSFVRSAKYIGPCRRVRPRPVAPTGTERRTIQSELAA